ncbi:hypothetical protein [Nocardiopsis sp. CA-288880]|uniref:hypothetical protein n=1 Tax=Nocardiopsis sp. CA-288880 TaxID=3239995 RepID=UPI003D9718B6
MSGPRRGEGSGDVALTALLVGAAPRLAPLGWAWLAYGVLVSVFGGLLDPDGRVMGLRAFETMPRLPVPVGGHGGPPPGCERDGGAGAARSATGGLRGWAPATA